MIGIGVKTKVRGAVLNEPAIVKQIDRARAIYLNRLGGTTRLIARRSIKKPTKKIRREASSEGRSASSRPGQPPFSHTKVLKDGIVYSVDRPAGVVTVGVLKRTSKPGEAPKALEHGGRVRVIRRNKSKEITSEFTRRIRPRPFMAPALMKVVPRMPEFWRDAILKATGSA